MSNLARTSYQWTPSASRDTSRAIHARWLVMLAPVAIAGAIVLAVTGHAWLLSILEVLSK